MDKEEIIKKTEEYAKQELRGESSGHDFFHTYRVLKLALKIGKKENADLFVVQLAALLHDISDWKLNDGNENIGSEKAREWLTSLGAEESVISHVCEIIKEMSFKGAGVKSEIKTEEREGKVVQDADRLDAIGAIGIARTFAFGGNKGREIYNPEIKAQQHETFEQYKTNKNPSINHFYEKLLLLKDLMNTETAKKIAEKRHKFMEKYLKEFFKEWEGKS